MSTSHSLLQFHKVLRQLARSGTWREADGLRALLQTAAEALGVAQIGVWLLSDDGSYIEAELVHDRLTGGWSSGVQLTRRAYPKYFEAIETAESLDAGDAVHDPRTRELADGYLTPLGIGAMLDAPLFSKGQLRGVVCHEHKGGPRQWTVEELTFASSIADLVTLALESAERERVEAELERTGMAYDLATDAAGMAAWRWDMRNDVVEWAPRIGEIMGYGRGWSPKNYEDYRSRLHPDDVEAVERAIQEGMAQPDDAYAVECRLRHADGHWLWTRGRGRFLRDADGEVVGILGVVWDVSDEKRLQTELNRGRKLEALGRLSAGIAHDFNNVLASVLSAADLLALDPTLSPTSKHMVASIASSASRASNLTHQLLAFARGQDVEVEPFDVAEAARAVGVLVAPLLGERVRLSFEIPGRRVVALASRGQLEQVLMNLVVNARDALSESGGHIRIQVGQRDVDARASLELGAALGRYASIRVIDDGVGMSPDVLDRIFDPFFTTRAPGQGTGLGLSTAYGLVQRVGGTLGVRSEVGVGTTFEVLLPLSHEEPKGEPPERSAPNVAQGLDLLLLEDEPPLREILTAMLEHAGHRVVVTASLTQALAALQGMAQLDVLVTDMRLPDGSGTDLAHSALDRFPDLGVVFITGYAPEGFSPVGKSSTFLMKPFRNAKLLESVADVSGR